MLGNDLGFKTFVTTTPVPSAVVLFGVGSPRWPASHGTTPPPWRRLQTLTHAVFSLGIIVRTSLSNRFEKVFRDLGEKRFSKTAHRERHGACPQ
jgi:hypothetical protein